MINLTVVSWVIWNENKQTVGIEHQEGYQDTQDKGCIREIALGVV